MNARASRPMELRLCARLLRPGTAVIASLALLCATLLIWSSSNAGILTPTNPAEIRCKCQASPPCRNEQIIQTASSALSTAAAALPTKAVTNHTVSGIPKILHYVFKGGQVFDTYKPLIKSCLDQNPDWQVMFWSDAHSERLIEEHYGHFIDKYRSYRDRLEKSDSVRYMILLKFGGIYLDMDVECRKPFSQLLSQPPVEESLIKASNKDAPATAFLGEERREQTRILYGYSYCAMNSMMGSRPGHPFFQLAISKMLGMPMLSHARLTTGPDFLTGLYRLWISCSAGDGRNCQADQPVMLYSARLVSPLMDTSLVNWESKCRPYFSKRAQAKLEGSEQWKAIGCSQLVSNGWNFDETDGATVAVHRFLHLGYGNQGHRSSFDLFKEFPRVKTHYPN